MIKHLPQAQGDLPEGRVLPFFTLQHLENNLFSIISLKKAFLIVSFNYAFLSDGKKTKQSKKPAYTN